MWDLLESNSPVGLNRKDPSTWEKAKLTKYGMAGREPVCTVGEAPVPPKTEVSSMLEKRVSCQQTHKQSFCAAEHFLIVFAHLHWLLLSCPRIKVPARSFPPSLAQRRAYTLHHFLMTHILKLVASSLDLHSLKCMRLTSGSLLAAPAVNTCSQVLRYSAGGREYRVLARSVAAQATDPGASVRELLCGFVVMPQSSLKGAVTFVKPSDLP
jgi:hypothetical protein